MEEIRRYLLSLITASLVCSLVRRLLVGKSQIKGITDMICGLFLGITILTPLVHVKIPDFRTYAQSYVYDAEIAAEAGRQNASQQLQGIIKQEVESYILEKAHARDLILSVDVQINEHTGIPTGVEIKGDVSPYDRNVLSEYISQTFDIPEESQKWG